MSLIKLFTHTDLDGAGCAILLKSWYGQSNVKVEYCDYKDVNDNIFNWINNKDYAGYEKVFITDISVNEQVATMLDKLNEQYYQQYNKNFVQLIDHHQTAEWLNTYDWSDVRYLMPNGDKASGTWLTWMYIWTQLCEGDMFVRYSYMLEADFAEIVRLYDTFEWCEKYPGMQEPKDMNTLFSIYGLEMFVEMMTAKLCNRTTTELIDQIEQKFISNEYTKTQKYVQEVLKNVYSVKVLEQYDAIVTFAEHKIADVGAALKEKFPMCQLFCIINMKGQSISYRTAVDDFNTGLLVAKYLGGGGHPKASGSVIPLDIQEAIAKEIFKQLEARFNGLQIGRSDI